MVAEVRRLSESVDRPVAHIEVLAATSEEQPVLANLLELYVYDFSELLGLEIGEDGRFGYPQLSLYWSEVARYPFLVRVDGKLAGFVLLKKGRLWPAGEWSGMSRSSSFCARIADGEWERMSRMRCGGGFQGNGKFE